MTPHPGEPAYYRDLCEHAAIALVATDAEFRIVCWNRAATEILNAPSDQMQGQSILEIAPPDRQKLLQKLLCRTRDRGERTEFEVSLPDAAGQPRELLVLLSPVPPSQQGPGGVAAWVVDETQRKKLTEQLSQAEKMASLGTLSAGVAHHFNNILGGVATFVDYALSSGDPAAQRRALQMTAEAASRASTITHSLLSFAEKDAHPSDMADLTEVVLTFVHLVERALEERRIAVDLQLNPVPIVPVEANGMHQVLGNLLSNAEDAMPEGGTITISLQRAGANVELAFQDNGEGIATDDLPMVFEPFFTTKGVHAGGNETNTGLGLSVVHGLVREMNGRIRAESEPGNYTRFVISLPIPPGSTARPAEIWPGRFGM